MTDDDDARREEVRRYVRGLRAFQVHAAVFAASMTLIIGVNAAVNANAGTLGQWSAWWSVWSLIGWGAGLTVHGLVVRLARRNLFQHDWEERKIDEILDQQRRP